MTHRVKTYLRTFRRRSGLTQAEVAFLLGAEDGAQVSRYERLSRRPSFQTALGLQAVFGIPAETLLPAISAQVERKIMARAHLLSRRLERKGFTVVLALDGAEGIQKAKSDSPDLILMDMSLPVIDGWEATRQLKADEATRRIPIIALTAHAMTSDEEKARAAGCDDFDTKPIELPRLLGKIEAQLQRAPPG